jgi:hypothetical protein
MPQNNAQKYIFDESISTLPPETLAMQKAKQKSVRAANDNSQRPQNVIAGKFTEARNESLNTKAEEQRDQANTYLSPQLQGQIDSQQRFGPKPANDNISEQAKKAELDAEYRNTKNNFNNPNLNVDEQMNRARAMNIAANDNQDQKTKLIIAKKIEAIQRVFREEGIDLSQDEALKLLESNFKVPFPSFMFMFAVIKDLSDLVFIGSFITPFYHIAHRVWIRNYTKNIFGKNNDVYTRIISRTAVSRKLTMAAEYIPIINMLTLNIASVSLFYKFVNNLCRKSKVAIA